jgi:RES domain-containing protein
MLAWRVSARQHALDATGYGAWLNGGRWNSKHVFAIYLGTTPEICSLEKLVHAGRPFPANLALVSVTLPDDPALYLKTARNRLPKRWNKVPPGANTASFGDRILAANWYLGFFVPSVLMPETENLVLNPRHPATARVVFKIERPFEFDPRIR